ncbi:XRE family transcriptional regulator, partial [Streptomyces sp. Alain-F2R5]
MTSHETGPPASETPVDAVSVVAPQLRALRRRAA